MGIGEKGRVDLSEVIRNRLYFAPLHWTEDSVVLSALPRAGSAFCIDNELVYEPFFADFGPLNLGCTYRFCWRLHSLLKEAEDLGRCVLFYCGADPKKKANAAVLLGTYLVLFASVEPEVAYGPLSMFEPYIHFRDPTCGVSTYHLTVLDCIRGTCVRTISQVKDRVAASLVICEVAVAKASKVGWIDFNNFNLEEYEYFEQVENGDLNWIVPNKLLAFSGPSARRLEVGTATAFNLFLVEKEISRNTLELYEIYGYRTLIPEDYVEYFHRVGVTSVIRLNKRTYDRRRFADQGIAHYDLYFPDGSCPTDRILKRFLEIVEETSGSLAVHCKAGLGRTGVLIGCYIMKHYRFTCAEVLGYLRIVRPGSVIGPQQHYLRDMQKRLWRAGDIMRQQLAQVNANSRDILPSSANDSAPPSSLLIDQATKSLAASMVSSSTGAQSWTASNKNSFTSNRVYATNPVVKKETARDLAAPRNGLAKVSQRSPHPSWTEQHVPPLLQRLKRISLSHASASCLPSPMKEDRSNPNEILVCGNINCLNSAAVSSGCNESKEDGSKLQKMRVPTPARPSSMQKSTQVGLSKGSCFETSMRSCSLNTDKEPSCSHQSNKSTRGHPHNGRSWSTPKHHGSSPCLGTGSDGLGILRNVGSVGSSVQSSGNVFVQRIVNSAGQPRKVVLPAVEETPGSGSGLQERKKREGSPSRRFVSPGRVSVSQGTS